MDSRHVLARRFRRIGSTLSTMLGVVGVSLLSGGCGGSQPIIVATTPGPAVNTTTAAGVSDADASVTGGATARRDGGWHVETREHVDLWLHGFALLQNDASLVPYFRLGYRESLQGVRASVNSQLDANRSELQRLLGANSNLTSAQFLALYFANWDDMRRGIERFVAAEGDVRNARNQEELRMFATIRTYFPTSADRDWLRLFTSSLDDERSRFYRSYWMQQQQRRAGMRASIESLWSGSYRAALSRFLNNSAQRDGAILLSLVLGGEGRSLNVGQRDNFMAVTFPGEGGDPREALFVIAHEVVGGVTTAAVRDNASAAEDRSGDAGRWSTLAAVRGGAMLLERVAPDLLAGYQRYYLSLARVKAGTDDAASFVATFPLPPQIVTALERQIDVVLGGI